MMSIYKKIEVFIMIKNKFTNKLLINLFLIMDLRDAIINNDYNSFKNKLKLTTNIDKINDIYKFQYTESTLLYYGCSIDNNRFAKLLLKQKNINVNKCMISFSPLFCAIMCKNFKIAKLLLFHKRIKLNLENICNNAIFVIIFNTDMSIDLRKLLLSIRHVNLNINNKNVLKSVFEKLNYVIIVEENYEYI